MVKALYQTRAVESQQWDERDLAVYHLRRPHQCSGGVLACAGILA
jgi:hypothetical protein